MKKTGIVIFAFGAHETIISNQVLASIGKNQANKLNAEIFTQDDIPIAPCQTVTKIEETRGLPPTTLRIVRESIRWALEKNITHLCVVTAVPHQWRAKRDMERMLKSLGSDQGITFSICNETQDYSNEIWFCRDSTQSRTHSEKNWIKRELIFQLMPYFIYVIISAAFDSRHYVTKPL